MNTSMIKLLGIFALSVALVFLEGLLPERRRIKARSTETRNTKASMRYPNLLANQMMMRVGRRQLKEIIGQLNESGAIIMDDKQGTIAGLLSCAVILVIALFVLMSSGGLQINPYTQYVPQQHRR